MRKRLLFVLAMCLLFAACDQSPADKSGATPPPSPEVSPTPAKVPLSAEAAVAEKEYQLPAGYEVTALVRREAGEWAMKQNPGWQVKGISCFSTAFNNAYYVDVELSRNKDSQVVRLFMQAMFANDGTYYWKPTPITLEQRIAASPASPGT